MPTVTLVLASGPQHPQGSPDHRFELDLALDRDGRPDPAAWAADPTPWPARRYRPGDPVEVGDVQYDEESGWRIHFQDEDGAGADDAPLAALIRYDGRWRPGEILTLTGRSGRDTAWRIVAVN
ncbi:hypothetical protein C8P66_11213 [Humitalea rosea]|uniref:Uncharacterized protein n=1 Tax=Humitalea rosea TaxID=990373 RepID=A0A2W7IEA3_9PROT|nr:hypothetical protein [Humitalea rosea]PZW44998.1 hypothetical protein C8P66_11213 [Humitalea rosea]